MPSSKHRERPRGQRVQSTDGLSAYLKNQRIATEEQLVVFGLDARHRIIFSQCLPIPTGEVQEEHLRTLFSELVYHNCAAVISAHVHPAFELAADEGIYAEAEPPEDLGVSTPSPALTGTGADRGHDSFGAPGREVLP